MTIRFTPAAMVWAALALLVGVRADESNFWPGPVVRTGAAAEDHSWTALGPFLFNEPSPAGGRVEGFRPLYVKRLKPNGETAEVTVLYPLFFYRTYGDTSFWSIFDLIIWTGRRGAAPQPSEGKTFDIWPFYFSRETSDPATTYHGLFPIAGSLQGLLGYDRASWVLFPLYVQTEKHGAVTTSTPWPFIRSTHGTENGFVFWPLFGKEERPGVFVRRFWLWPFVWNNVEEAGPDKPAGTPPKHSVGVIPFYTTVRSPDFNSVTFVGPFFGSADRVAPYHYHENDYFWPFFVQGRGDDRYINRWAPFYTHSVIKGYDKRWTLWPLLRQAHWDESGLAQSKTSFLWFVWWHEEQRSLAHPAAAPAKKTSLWPLLTTWDNGAGRRQVQFLSPYEGMFTDNEESREAWAPLTAVVRYDQRAPGEMRTSILWNALTWERSDSKGSRELHVGPLFSRQTRPDSGRWSIGNGLFGMKRGPQGSSWRPFWLEFSSKDNKVAAAVR